MANAKGTAASRRRFATRAHDVLTASSPSATTTQRTMPAPSHGAGVHMEQHTPPSPWARLISASATAA